MSVYLYPPAIEDRMPAFAVSDENSNDECRIYFSLSKFNNANSIQHVQLSLKYADSGAKALNSNTYTTQIKAYPKTTDSQSNQVFFDSERAAVSDYCYYVKLSDEDVAGGNFTPEKIYKAQIRLSTVPVPNISTPPTFDITQSWLASNIANFSEWSTICFITPIVEPFVFIKGMSTGTKSYQTSTYDLLRLSADQFDGSGLLYGEGQPLASQAINLPISALENPESADFKIKISPLLTSLTVFTGEDEGYGNLVFSGQYSSLNSSETLSSFDAQLFSATDLLYPIAEVQGGKPDAIFYNGVPYDSSGAINYSYGTEAISPVFNTFHFSFDAELINSNEYHLKFTYTTKNGFQATQEFTFFVSLDATLLNQPITVTKIEDSDNGRVGFQLSSSGKRVSGALIVRRADSKNNFRNWKTIYERPVDNSVLLETIYDYSVEAGTLYKYLVNGQVPLNSKTNKVDESPVLLDYSDMFLIGDKQQLNIKFNPQISSFKNTVAENKIETLGGRYPFVSRSGQMSYREILISGLISSEADEQNLFITDSELFQEYSELLKSHEYIAERLFREKVLAFLQDGKPKVFKSTTEGNVLVRVMDVSLSPEAALGRRLYSFSATLVEIDRDSLENRKKYNINIADAITNTFYMIAASVSIEDGHLATINAEHWTSPVSVITSGDPAVDKGKNRAIVYIYNRGAQALSPITSVYKYECNTKQLSGLTNGWSATIPAPKENELGYYRTAEVQGLLPDGTPELRSIQPSDWSEAKPISWTVAPIRLYQLVTSGQTPAPPSSTYYLDAPESFKMAADFFDTQISLSALAFDSLSLADNPTEELYENVPFVIDAFDDGLLKRDFGESIFLRSPEFNLKPEDSLWSLDKPSSIPVGKQLFQTTALVVARPADSMPIVWSQPEPINLSTQDAFVTLYQLCSDVHSNPALPADNASFSFSDKSFSSPGDLNGWSLTKPDPAAGQSSTWWMICAIASGDNSTTSIPQTAWTTPKTIGYPIDSYDKRYVYLYKQDSWAQQLPAPPQRQLTYNFADGNLSGQLDGWTLAGPSGAGD